MSNRTIAIVAAAILIVIILGFSVSGPGPENAADPEAAATE